MYVSVQEGKIHSLKTQVELQCFIVPSKLLV